jgi:hypothetical protein
MINSKGFSLNMLMCRMAGSVILAAVLFLPSFVLAGAISNVAYDQQNPDTIYLIDQGNRGIWLTVWEDWRNRDAVPPAIPTGADIRGKFINPDGTACGTEFIIAKSAGNQTAPKAAYRPDPGGDPAKSKVVVVWQDTQGNFISFNTLSNIDEAANCTRTISAKKTIKFNPIDLDLLLGRMHPRINYDQTDDRFWIVWKETRSMLHQIDVKCFGFARFVWEFDDLDFIGYVRLSGNTLAEQPSEIGIAGADIVRNGATTTVRQLSGSDSALAETRIYESFNSVNNPDVACDDVMTQCLIASEGVRTKETLTCKCEDKSQPANGVCDQGVDIVTATLTTESFDDGLVHVYGIWDNYMSLPVVSSMKLDTGSKTAHYPAVGFDPITGKFLTAWEDMRDGAKTKIWGQLLFSGGGFYNDNFIISYQDLDKNGTNDTNVLNSKQTKPFISYDDVNESFFVAWQDQRNGVTNMDIYSQRVDAEGTLRGNNSAIVTQPGNQYYPSIAFNYLTDRFLVVWKDARNFDKDTCTLKAASGGTLPCGSDVYSQIFKVGPPPEISVSPSSFKFADQRVGTTSIPKAFTVTNNGNAGSFLKMKSVTATSPFSVSSDTCTGNILGQGETCTISVVFTPTTAVTYSSKLTINSDDPVTPAATVTLSGTGMN